MSRRGKDDPLAVSEKRDRRRKRKGLPDPLPSQKAAEAETLETLMNRPTSPSIRVEPTDDGSWLYTSPHNDYDLWGKQIALAMGTRSHAVVRVFVRDLRRLCAKDWEAGAGRWMPDNDELNTAVAMVADWQPENTAQAALASQLVALHWMMMRLSKQALNSGGPVMEKDAALAGKLARSYGQLCETMQMLKGKRQPIRQTFAIEKTLRQEVHYYDNRGGGAAETDGRVHERDGLQPARIIDQRDPLRREDEGGVVVPMPSAGRKK